MSFITENFLAIIVTVGVVFAAGFYIVEFWKKTKDAQISNVKEWLLYAVTLAEKELGGGTGELKLRYVYDMFVAKFVWLGKIISFDMFSEMVDEVLERMNHLLATNVAIEEFVFSDSLKGGMINDK